MGLRQRVKDAILSDRFKVSSQHWFLYCFKWVLTGNRFQSSVRFTEPTVFSDKIFFGTKSFCKVSKGSERFKNVTCDASQNHLKPSWTFENLLKLSKTIFGKQSHKVHEWLSWRLPPRKDMFSLVTSLCLLPEGVIFSAVPSPRRLLVALLFWSLER